MRNRRLQWACRFSVIRFFRQQDFHILGQIGKKGLENIFFLLLFAFGIGNPLAGYIYYYLTNEKQIAEDTRLTEQKIKQVCQQDTLAPVGKIQSVGIKETFRRQGLAVWLMKYALRQFAEKGIGEVFIICWNAGGKVPLERALQECKFVHLVSAKMIWYNKKELYCPYCKGRCKCDAEVYFKKVKERNCK